MDAAIALADSVAIVNVHSCIIDDRIGIDSAMNVKSMIITTHCAGTIWQVVGW